MYKAYWYCVSACPVVKLAFPYFRLVQNITNSASIDTIRIPLNNPMATMIIGVIPLLITEVHRITTNLLNKGNYRATSLPQTVVPNSLSESCRTDFPEIAEIQVGMFELFLDWSIPRNYLKLTGKNGGLIGWLFCQLIPHLGHLHRYNFSPFVRTPSGYLHQYETCIKIVRWWCMTCGTPELSWLTCATKARRLRPRKRANAFYVRLTWFFFFLCCWRIVELIT